MWARNNVKSQTPQSKVSEAVSWAIGCAQHYWGTGPASRLVELLSAAKCTYTAVLLLRRWNVSCKDRPTNQRAN